MVRTGMVRRGPAMVRMHRVRVKQRPLTLQRLSRPEREALRTYHLCTINCLSTPTLNSAISVCRLCCIVPVGRPQVRNTLSSENFGTTSGVVVGFTQEGEKKLREDPQFVDFADFLDKVRAATVCIRMHRDAPQSIWSHR